jgi:hypothetical protein
LARCTYCGKYYQVAMITFDGQGQEQCLHCLFWMNYDETSRLEFDKTCSQQGIGIAQYILDCNEIHNIATCIRGSAGCFLCDFKMKVPICNILNPDMLGSSVTSSVQQKNLTNYSSSDANQLDQETVAVYYSGDVCVPIRIPNKLTI